MAWPAFHKPGGQRLQNLPAGFEWLHRQNKGLRAAQERSQRKRRIQHVSVSPLWPAVRTADGHGDLQAEGQVQGAIAPADQVPCSRVTIKIAGLLLLQCMSSVESEASGSLAFCIP